MAQPFIGEIRSFGFNFAPVGWMFCNGQLLPISQFTPLFAIIGTTFGGNGQSTFGLPNLQGSSPMHWGTGAGLTTVLGESQGVTAVTLLITQIPQHAHTINAASVPPNSSPERSPGPKANSFLAETNSGVVYQQPGTPNTPFAAAAMTSTGGSQPHDNMQPYLAINFCIATEGIFPSRN
jgi:microcystin-dependent protein